MNGNYSSFFGSLWQNPDATQNKVQVYNQLAKLIDEFKTLKWYRNYFLKSVVESQLADKRYDHFDFLPYYSNSQYVLPLHKCIDSMPRDLINMIIDYCQQSHVFKFVSDTHYYYLSMPAMETTYLSVAT